METCMGRVHDQDHQALTHLASTQSEWFKMNSITPGPPKALHYVNTEEIRGQMARMSQECQRATPVARQVGKSLQKQRTGCSPGANASAVGAVVAAAEEETGSELTTGT